MCYDYEVPSVRDCYDDEEILEVAKEIQEEQLKSLVKSVSASLNEDVKKEIETLKKENKQLAEIKNQYSDFLKAKERVEQKEKDLIKKQETLEQTLNQKYRDATLKDIINKLLLPTSVYRLDYCCEEKPKCNLCDEKRQYHFTTPDGVEHTVKCKCSESIKHYYVRKQEDRKIKIICLSKEKRKQIPPSEYILGKDILLSFREEDDYDYDYAFDVSNDIVIDSAKEAIEKEANIWQTLFTSEIEAQKYADYLNKKHSEDGDK